MEKEPHDPSDGEITDADAKKIGEFIKGLNDMASFRALISSFGPVEHPVNYEDPKMKQLGEQATETTKSSSTDNLDAQEIIKDAEDVLIMDNPASRWGTAVEISQLIQNEKPEPTIKKTINNTSSEGDSILSNPLAAGVEITTAVCRESIVTGFGMALVYRRNLFGW